MALNDRLIRQPEVLSITGLSPSALARLVRSKHFPSPVKLTLNGRAVGFSLAEVQAWIAERIAASRSIPSAA